MRRRDKAANYETQEEEQRSNNMLQRMRREANDDGRAGEEILVERDRRRGVSMPLSPPDIPPVYVVGLRVLVGGGDRSALTKDTRLHVETTICH